jgi:hypothetical protein
VWGQGHGEPAFTRCWYSPQIPKAQGHQVPCSPSPVCWELPPTPRLTWGSCLQVALGSDQHSLAHSKEHSVGLCSQHEGYLSQAWVEGWIPTQGASACGECRWNGAKYKHSFRAPSLEQRP